MQQFTIACIIHQHPGSDTCHQLSSVCMHNSTQQLLPRRCCCDRCWTRSADQMWMLTWLEAQIVAYVAYAILLRLRGSTQKRQSSSTTLSWGCTRCCACAARTGVSCQAITGLMQSPSCETA
jgi:hypothetical protein